MMRKKKKKKGSGWGSFVAKEKDKSFLLSHIN
jgi:hypothetical protein